MTSEQNQKTRKASKNMTNIDKSIQIKSMSDFSNISLRWFTAGLTWPPPWRTPTAGSNPLLRHLQALQPQSSLGQKGNLIVVCSKKESINDLKVQIQLTQLITNTFCITGVTNRLAVRCVVADCIFILERTTWLGFVGFVGFVASYQFHILHSGPDQPTPFEANAFQRLHETRIPPGDSGLGTATVLNLLEVTHWELWRIVYQNISINIDVTNHYADCTRVW